MSPNTSSAREKVLSRLMVGPATNVELNETCFRYGARIHELRSEGYVITTERQTDGVFKYELYGGAC